MQKHAETCGVGGSSSITHSVACAYPIIARDCTAPTRVSLATEGGIIDARVADIHFLSVLTSSSLFLLSALTSSRFDFLSVLTSSSFDFSISSDF